MQVRYNECLWIVWRGTVGWIIFPFCEQNNSRILEVSEWDLPKFYHESCGTMIFAPLQLWLSPLQWVLKWYYLTIILSVLIPCDAMRKRGLCYRPVSVRASVCLSVTLVRCTHTAENIVKLLCKPCRTIILLFCDPSGGTQFQRERLQRVQYSGVGKFSDFWLKSPFISETVRERPMLAMKR